MPTRNIPEPIPENMFELAALEARDVKLNGTGDRHVHAVHVPERVDVAAIRVRLALTQAAFAARFGFSLRAVQQWEQGVRRPEGPARVLLAMTAADPAAVRSLLEKAGLSA
jgi:putative transcriptional regulator